MILWVFFIFTVFLLLLWKDTRKPKGFPPGPKWLPFIGCIPLLKQLLSIYKFHHLVWQHISLHYGPIVGIRVGKSKLIVISGRDAAKEFYSRDEFSGRPDGFFFRIRYFNKRLGIVFNDGREVDEHRKFALKAFKQLGNTRHGINGHIEKEAFEMIEYFRAKSKSGVVIDMHNAFDIPVLNVMWALLAGYRFHAEDEKLLTLLDWIHKSFKVFDMSGGVINQFPFIRYIFPEKSGYNQLMKALEPLWKFLGETIDEINEDLDEDEKPKSLVEAFLLEIKKTNGGSKVFTNEQLLSLCLDLFQAGSETTSNTLGFGMLYMLHYPEVLAKVRQEIDEHVGRNRMPCLADRSNLHYVEATLCEIQRFSTVAPLAIAHRAMETTKFYGYVIPKDTIALVSLYSLNMDPSYWKDPQNFRPERFLDDKGRLMQHDMFIPFGLGKRRCMGENMAKGNLFMFFTAFIHAFEISVPEGEGLPDLEGYDGITISPKPYKVFLKAK